MASWGRVALLAATAGALLGGGALLRAQGGPVERLRGFLWALSAVAVGGTAAVALTEFAALEESDGGYGWILMIGLATAGLLVAVSIPTDETVLLGLGIVGIVVYVPRIVFEYFGDTAGATFSLLMVGAVLVAVALTLTRAGARWRRRTGP